MINIEEHQGLIAIFGIVIASILAYLGFRKYQKHGMGTDNSRNDNSPYIKAGGDITAGGSISVGNHKIINNNDQGLPEIHLHLSGNGTNLTGHIEKSSTTRLVVLYIKIDGIKTELDQEFTKLVPLNNLNYSKELFNKKQDKIKVEVQYRTLGGDLYSYIRNAQQVKRADGKFNISLIGSPTIKPIPKLSKEAIILVSEAKEANRSIYIINVDQIPNPWVRIGKENYLDKNNPRVAVSYNNALDDLITYGYVKHAGGIRYELTKKGWDS